MAAPLSTHLFGRLTSLAVSKNTLIFFTLVATTIGLTLGYVTRITAFGQFRGLSITQFNIKKE